MQIASKQIANTATLMRLDASVRPTPIPPELKARLEAVERPAPDPSIKPDNHPDNIYAKVIVNGEVVATLYKGGSAITSNATYGRVKNLPSMTEAETLVGPALAQKRADEIAAALGGRVELVTSAPSQAVEDQQRALSPLVNVSTQRAATLAAREFLDLQLFAQREKAR